MNSRRNVVLGRVQAFATCGPSAQLLVLENGGWEKLDQWFRTGIACRDPVLLEEVLQIALHMPTGCTLLEKQGKGLPLSVENLVRKIHGGQANEYGAEDQKKLNALCLELVVRWLKIRKLREEADVGDRTEFVVEGGGKGALAKIDDKPGWGFMVVNGKVKVVQLVEEEEEEEPEVKEEVAPLKMEVEVVEETPAKRPPSVTPMPSSSSSGFLVSPAPSPQLSDSSPPAGEGKVGEEPVVEAEEDLDILVLQDDDEETNRILDDIDPIRDLGPVKKIIRWWGVDGVKDEHSYPPGEYHRQGCVKEKWMSISVSEDEEQPPQRKTRWDPAPAPRNWREWKLRKVIVEKQQAHRFPVEMRSEEAVRHPGHKIRPFPAEVSDNRDTPWEPESPGEGGGEKEEGAVISAEDTRGGDDVQATEVHNWQQSQWPEPQPPRLYNPYWGSNVNGGGGGEARANGGGMN